MIERVRKLGCAVIAISDGDVMGSLRVLVPHGKADIAMGVGGAPEGVITACATRLLGGEMQARPAPQSDDERSEMEEEGVDLKRVLAVDDLVGSPDCAFIATGVTTSALLPNEAPGAGACARFSSRRSTKASSRRPCFQSSKRGPG